MRTLKPLRVIADWLERPERTVRAWYTAGMFTVTACDVKTRAVLVDMREAIKLHEKHPTRRRR